MSIRINSFSSNENKELFANKFSNIETYFRKVDEKKSILVSPGSELLAVNNKNSLKQEEGVKYGNANPRKSRKSVIFSPRKSMMFDSKLALDSLQASVIEKNRNNLKNLDLTKLNDEQLLDLTVTVLQKPSMYRTSNDIKLIVKTTENIKFFQELSQENGPEIHEQISRYISHKYLPNGEIVFQEGSIGTTFYIILRGSVSVCKFEKIQQESNYSPERGTRTSIKRLETVINPQFKRTATSLDSIGTPLFEKRFLESNSPTLLSPTKRSIISQDIFGDKILTEIKVLEKGTAFGELALIENKPRAATIKCRENCHFAVLDKIFFSHILKENEQKKLFQHIDFFSNLSLFKHWTYNEVKNLKLHSDSLEFKRNQFVYKENDQPNYFYIVRSGEFKLVKELCILSDKDLMNKKIRETEIPKFIKSEKNTAKEFELAILMPGEFFGEEELLDNSTRRFSVICSHPGTIYTINRKEFFRRVLNDPSSKSYIYEKANQKLKWWGKRITNFLFSQSQANSFLRELISQQQLPDFSLKEMDLLLKSELFEESDPFAETIQNSQSEDLLKSKQALKDKITNAMGATSSLLQTNDFILLQVKNKPKIGKINQSLFDYFMETFNRKRGLDNYCKKMMMKNSDKKSSPIKSLVKKLVDTEERETNNKSPFIFSHYEDVSFKKATEEKKNLGFLTDRREKAKTNTLFPSLKLEILGTLKTNENLGSINSERGIKKDLPLKYQSKEIYKKIFEKQKKIRGGIKLSGNFHQKQTTQ